LQLGFLFSNRGICMRTILRARHWTGQCFNWSSGEERELLCVMVDSPIG
jgi:hypothetical protein